jgi:hypothetical protein
MLGAACAVVGAALVTAAAVPATPPERPGADSAAISLSSAKAGDRPVALTIRLHTELRCGRLTGSVKVGLPAGATVPRTIRPSAVLVGTRSAGSVAVSGHTISIAPPLPGGMICNVIAPGIAKIVLTRAAGIGNPSRPGRYTVSIRHRGRTLTATTRIV